MFGVRKTAKSTEGRRSCEVRFGAEYSLLRARSSAVWLKSIPKNASQRRSDWLLNSGQALPFPFTERPHERLYKSYRRRRHCYGVFRRRHPSACVLYIELHTFVGRQQLRFLWAWELSIAFGSYVC